MGFEWYVCWSCAEKLDGDGISQRCGRHEMGLVSMKLDQHQRALLKDRIRIRNVSRQSPICVWRVPGYYLDLARQQREQELYVEYGKDTIESRGAPERLETAVYGCSVKGQEGVLWQKCLPFEKRNRNYP